MPNPPQDTEPPAEASSPASAPAMPVSAAPVAEAAPAVEATPTATSENVPPGQEPPRHRKKHKARIEHKVRGRIRLKVPAAKNDPAILEAYKQAFSSIPGIDKVKVKPETGSIVIHYDPEREKEFEQHFQTACGHHEFGVEAVEPPPDEINDLARKIEREAEFLAGHSELAKTTVEFFKKFDRELKITTGNTVDLKIVLAGGLAAYTFLEIGASAATPMWVTLGLFSLNHFAELHGSHLAATSRPPGPAPAPVRA